MNNKTQSYVPFAVTLIGYDTVDASDVSCAISVPGEFRHEKSCGMKGSSP